MIEISFILYVYTCQIYSKNESEESEIHDSQYLEPSTMEVKP